MIVEVDVDIDVQVDVDVDLDVIVVRVLVGVMQKEDRFDGHCSLTFRCCELETDCLCGNIDIDIGRSKNDMETLVVLFVLHNKNTRIVLLKRQSIYW